MAVQERIAAWSVDREMFCAEQVLGLVLRSYGGHVRTRIEPLAAFVAVEFQFRSVTVVIQFDSDAASMGAIRSTVRAVGLDDGRVERHFENLLALWLCDSDDLWEARRSASG